MASFGSGNNRVGIRRWLRAALGVGVAVFCFLLLSRLTDSRAVWDALRHFWWPVFILVAPLFALQMWLRVVRWSLLLVQGTAALRLLYSAMMIGYAFNAILPVGIGEVSRIYVLRRQGNVPVGRAGASIALERSLDVLFAALLVCGSALTLDLPPWALRAALLGGAFSLAVVLGIYLLSRLRYKFLAGLEPRLRNTPLKGLWDVLHSSLELYGEIHTFGRWMRPLAWSCVIWALAVGVTHGIVLSSQVTVPLGASMLIVGAASLGMAVPTAPGYLGVYHGIVVACLALFDVPTDEALALAIVLHAVSVLPAAAVGLFCMWSSKLYSPSLRLQDNQG